MKRSSIFGILSGRYLFHVLVWLVYASYVFLETQGYITRKGWLFSIPPFFISLSLVAILVYGNALILIPKLFDRKKTALYFIAVLLLLLLNTYLKSINLKYWDSIAYPKDIMSITSYFKWNFFNSIWSILISTLLIFSQKWSEQKQQVRNIEVAQLKTELKYLRSQLNPHFLFNGLNTVYSYIDTENWEARDMMVQFSDLLRYNLYEADVDLIDLAKEIKQLQNYVALQKARSNDNIQIELNINFENAFVKIAPLIFMPFVENAFKYVTRDDQVENCIMINLRQEGTLINFKCENTYEEVDLQPGGIGLSNVLRRLELLYRDSYQLDINKSADIYHVHLKINL